jgi:amidase
MPIAIALNAFVEGPRAERPPTGAGALDGLAFAVKDLIDVAATPTGGGNPDWRAAQIPAIRSAPIVELLLAAGARLVGKTITDELAFSLEGANAHAGTPLNPRAPDRLPGGSSSGSASATAGGAVDFALGTDTGGSVRIPAAFCGVYGMRPTHGSIPLAGVVPFAPSYETIGWFAPSAALLQRVGDTVLPAAPASRPPRFLLAEDGFALADAPVAQALRRDLPAELRRAERVRIFDGGEADWLEAYRVLQGAEIWRSLGGWITRTRPRFGAAIAQRFDEAAAITQAEVERWQPRRAAIRTRLARLLGDDGVVVLPASPTVAPLKSAPPAEIGAFYRAALTLTSVAGHAGLPQISVPLGSLDGAPVGLSLLGAAGADRMLLAQVHRIFAERDAANG